MEGGDIDFEPTGEGSENINDPINNDDLEELFPNLRGDDNPTWCNKFRKFFKDRGIRISTEKPGEKDSQYYNRIREEIELKDYSKDLKQRSHCITTAKSRIIKMYPDWSTTSSPFTFDLDEFDRVMIRLKTKTSKTYLFSDYDKLPSSIKNALGESAEEIKQYNEGVDIINRDFPRNKLGDDYDNTIDDDNKVLIKRKGLVRYQNLFSKDGELNHYKRKGLVRYQNLFSKDGELNQKLPKTVKETLGGRARVIIDDNEEVINKNIDKITKFKEKIEEINEEDTTEIISTKEKLNESIHEQIQTTETEIEQLEQENEVIEDRLPLRERIKTIFKKYGFTITAVVSAVSIIIGVIVSTLQSGLSNVAKGVGKRLKTIGKKLGEILPGMIGAIASFIFKTEGEVVRFLAKNAWLLIVAVVLYFVERYKKKR